MSSIIEGLKLDVSADEMKQHALRRCEHHRGRAEIYESKVKEIEELQKSSDESQRQISKLSNANSENPVANLEETAKKHRRKERFFRFASEHFKTGETYRLALTDLESFELAPGQRW